MKLLLVGWHAEILPNVGSVLIRLNCPLQMASPAGRILWNEIDANVRRRLLVFVENLFRDVSSDSQSYGQFFSGRIG